MNANGNTITSFARELNPTGVGEHIYIYIYIVIHTYIYIYIYANTHTHTHTYIYAYLYTDIHKLLSVMSSNLTKYFYFFLCAVNLLVNFFHSSNFTVFNVEKPP